MNTYGNAERRPFFASGAVLAVTTLLFIYFMVSVLPEQSAAASAWSPKGATFDTVFFYSPDTATRMAGVWTQEGRLSYIFARWSFDLVWPVVYGAFVYAAWLFSLWRLSPSARAGSGRSPASRFAWIALLGPAFDYAENIAATLLLSSVQPPAQGIAVVASIASALKWVFVSVGMVGALFLPIFLGVRTMLAARPPRSRARYLKD